MRALRLGSPRTEGEVVRLDGIVPQTVPPQPSRRPRRPRPYARALGTLALGATFAVARPSQAQVAPALALDKLAPAPAGDPLLTVESPTAGRGLALSALGSYARAPLAATGSEDARIVDYQLITHALIAFDVASRLKLDFDAPFVVAQDGTARRVAGQTFAKPTGGWSGDVRFGARVVAVESDGLAPGVAAGFRIFAPTAAGEQYAGAGGVRYAPSLTVGGASSRFVWSASAWRTWASAKATHGDLSGSDVGLGLGGAVRFGPAQVGVETFGATITDASTDAFSRATTRAEALLVGRAQAGRVDFSAAAGPGLGGGIGTPAYRVLLGVTFTSSLDDARRSAAAASRPAGSSGSAPSSGRPASGSASARVSIASAPEAGPALDTDGDGVPDAEDACPLVVGDAAPSARRRGCPADRDDDGVPDAQDACPDAKGPASDDPAKSGCPVDTDGDGVFDPDDACPRDRGPRTTDPKTSGCPTSVRVSGTQIVIREQVQFETGSDRIKPESFALLGQVADVLRDHPEIARVAVDGHTDDVGVARNNLALSQRRAVAVVRWLTEHGVDSRRVEARGFGPRRPIAENKTDEGRAKNRRVEFQIRRQTPEGESGWRDGPVE